MPNCLWRIRGPLTKRKKSYAKPTRGGAVDAPVQVNTAVATGLAVAALLGTSAASLGGLLAVPMARRLAH
jgi:hypothetical protein